MLCNSQKVVGSQLRVKGMGGIEFCYGTVPYSCLLLAFSCIRTKSNNIKQRDMTQSLLINKNIAFWKMICQYHTQTGAAERWFCFKALTNDQ